MVSDAHSLELAYSCFVRVNADPTIYHDVQSAVDAASAGDVVKVAGDCRGVATRSGLTQSAYLDKSITVQGGYTTSDWSTPDPVANPTTIDAHSEGRVLYVTGVATAPTVRGLRLTGGNASGQPGGT